MADVRDFYMRSESDPQFRKDQLEVYDEIEATVDKIKMTLGTKKGEVLGEYNFGDKVRVSIKQVNPKKRQIDLELVV